MSRTSIAVEHLAKAYLNSKQMVLAAGFGDEIIWQKNLRLDAFTEHELLRETAWVILSAGMREAVIRKKFPEISEAFFLWKSARVISDHASVCESTALKTFNHRKKIGAIIDVARRIDASGFDKMKAEIVADALGTLQKFPFIGQITVYHLAKNLGANVAKPDRHLTKLAWACGFSDVQDFCQIIAAEVGDTVSEVDIVLWRFATLLGNYLDSFVGSSTDRYGVKIQSGVNA
jgi:hypothetical protein